MASAVINDWMRAEIDHLFPLASFVTHTQATRAEAVLPPNTQMSRQGDLTAM
jgi:hypothetical protein